MDRVNGADTVDIGGGRRGFRSQNAGAGIIGTEVTADWLNAVQENLLKVIEEAGLDLDVLNWDLLWLALLTHINKQQGQQVFTADGTFTVPEGVTEVVVEVFGGGGAGGDTGSASTGGGGGGGGGGRAWKRVTGLVPGTNIAVTVGAPGVAVGNASMQAGSGGTSSFGPHCSATGGTGGYGPGHATSPGFPGLGGTGVGGDVNSGGSVGHGGEIDAGETRGGGGGSAPGGGAGAGSSEGQSYAGQAPGGGGAGAGSRGAGNLGAAGARGEVRVWW